MPKATLRGLLPLLAFLISLSLRAQYCTLSLHSANCSATDAINAVVIAGTTLNNTNTGCNGTSTTPSYSAFPATGRTTAILAFSGTYSISVTSTTSSIISVWIDYNQNAQFEANEWRQIATTSTAGTPATITFTVPGSALAGVTRMRVRSRASGSPNGSTDACTQFFSGETEDYTITIGVPPPCTNPPAAGQISAGNNRLCPNDSTTIDVTGYTLGTTMQWQTSADSTNWTNLAGATQPYLVVRRPNAPIYYRLAVSCSTTVYTPGVRIEGNPVTLCYCRTNLHTNICNTVGTNIIAGTFISPSTFRNRAGICQGNLSGPVSNFPASDSTTTTLYRTVPYTLYVRSTSGTQISAWIDYNRNGQYESTEWLNVSRSARANGYDSINFTLPATAAVGITGLRIRTSTSTLNNATGACASFFNGETENYLVTLGGIPQCSSPPTVGSIVGPASVCGGQPASLALNAFVPGTHLQWQYSTDSTTWVNLPNDTIYRLDIAQVLEARYYRVQATCSTSTFSSVFRLGLRAPAGCYCVTNLHSGAALCQSNDWITAVNLSNSSLNNPSTGCAAGSAYVRYNPAGSLTGTLKKATGQQISVTTLRSMSISVWVDYNQNGLFEAIEYTRVTGASSGNVPATAVLNMPSFAKPGLTGMRIRVRAAGNQNGPTDACLPFSGGETEDYFITIDTVSTGVLSRGNRLGFTLYPNPTQGNEFSVALPSHFRGAMQIGVTDHFGRTVYRQQLQATGSAAQVSLPASLAKGLYLVKLTTAAGSSTQPLKLQ